MVKIFLVWLLYPAEAASGYSPTVRVESIIELVDSPTFLRRKMADWVGFRQQYPALYETLPQWACPHFQSHAAV